MYTLRIYNVIGQEIIRLVDKVQPTGRYTITWDARTAHGHPVASGIYLAHVEMPDLGEELILKLAIVQEQQVLRSY